MEAKEISTGTKSKDDARPTKEPKNSEDYSGTKSKDDAHPTKEPKNSEGKKVLTENTSNFPATCRFVADGRINASLARWSAKIARNRASVARDRASTALCIDKANAARAAADAADAAAVVADDAADAVDTATDCIAAGIVAFSHTKAVDDYEAANTLYMNHPDYYAALMTAIKDAGAASGAARSAAEEADAAKYALMDTGKRTLKRNMEAKEISTGTKSKDDARPTKEPKNSEDYSGTKSKDDAHPTKEPKNSEGKKVLTENTSNFPATCRFVADGRLNASLARWSAKIARNRASVARDRASTALCIDKANAARAAADAADAAAVVADDAADAVDTATDCIAAGIVAFSHTKAVDDYEAANTLYMNHPDYYAALMTAIKDAGAASGAARSAAEEADAAKYALMDTGKRTLKRNMEAKEISTGTKSKDDARPTKEPKNSEDYSGTKSKDDAHPTKEPKNSEGKKVLTENTSNFPATCRFVADGRINASLARWSAKIARNRASVARDRASTALCIDKANAARAAADAADAAAVVADDAADAVDTATDCIAAGIVAFSHTKAVDDYEAANTLYMNHPDYYAALMTAIKDAGAASGAARSAAEEADAAKYALIDTGKRTLKR
ncbi:uncharacterized protein LOC116405174 [Cucumis sativus]|uniref:uncharacterized protein LOC116405174 n=1 Tax=Cucumis sativus TaxID=3659 RepID=UPI0012F47B05|nr:uncharacterized protein LOC116405174 [Cucumis sativus]